MIKGIPVTPLTFIIEDFVIGSIIAIGVYIAYNAS